MGENRSVVQWYSKTDAHKCGYCKGGAGSIMFGMWAHRMTVDDYQILIDRGWRRSGLYCYKAVMDETCCPLYTIRCHALKFQLTKSQKKAIKKMNKFLKTGDFKEREEKDNDLAESSNEILPNRECPNQSINIDEIVSQANLTDSTHVPKQIGNAEQIKCTESGSSKEQEIAVDEVKSKILKQRAVKMGQGPDPNRPPCKKAKILRYEKKLRKNPNFAQKIEVKRNKSESKSLEEFLDNVSEADKHKLTLKLIEPSKSPSDWKKSGALEFEVYKKYQMVIHNDPPHKITLESFNRFLVATPLKRRVHPDYAEDSEVPAFGSFHQQYWLDDKLLAVGVIDILPNCISAVYFFYDPDYRELTLGTYGSLKEVQLIRELNASLNIPYYYMGYYIHSCKKMRYKGNMHPSDLLCPETYQWISIEKCLTSLDKKKYCRLNGDQTAIDLDECSGNGLNALRIFDGRRIIRYAEVQGELKLVEELKNIGKLIGRKAAKTVIIVL